MEKLLFKQEVYAIQGAIYEVYYQLGHGFLESVYQEALEKELAERSIPFLPQHKMYIKYKNGVLKHHFISDFICYGKIIVEIKSEKIMSSRDKAQLMNYLKISHCSLGLLVNFGSYPKVTIERVIMTDPPG